MPDPVKAIAEPAGSLATPQQPATGNAYLLGCLAALAVVFIWSSWLVASRSGALSGLTVYDLAALRYAISGLVALPFVLYFKPWKTLTIGQIAVLTMLLGPVYIMLVFNGFVFAPAAHGGIFMNGVLPVMTLAIGWLWLREAPRWQQLVAAAFILLATVAVASDKSQIAVAGSWRGDLLFLAAAAFFSMYMVLSRVWRI
ncbi:MAG: DMT family transporter, partial [Rhizobiales bacterium]|nr:DMT family transporter [Hyphomicrobiales bacterium]